MLKRHAFPYLALCVCCIAYGCGLDFSLAPGCGILARLLYPICHVNIWHLLGNCWCLWCIHRSAFRDHWYVWLTAYAIAVVTPSLMMPTMGLSGVLYAALGMLCWQAREKAVFHAWTIGFMLIGLFFPLVVNNFLHAWCYALGVAVGYGYAGRGDY